MIVAEDSPFRRLRADLDPRQASFLDGIRISAEMLDIAYQRLAGNLWTLSCAADDRPAFPTAAFFLDAWAVVDSAHRLRELFAQAPGFKKSGPKSQLFMRKTEDVSEFRNIAQHLRNDLTEMANKGWPSWGTLAWIAILDAAQQIGLSCVLVPGRVQTATHWTINPAGKHITVPIDHVTLSCKSKALSLTMLHEEAGKLIRAFEPSLATQIADHPTVAADMFFFIKFSLEPETVPPAVLDAIERQEQAPTGCGGSASEQQATGATDHVPQAATPSMPPAGYLEAEGERPHSGKPLGRAKRSKGEGKLKPGRTRKGK